MALITGLPATVATPLVAKSSPTAERFGVTPASREDAADIVHLARLHERRSETKEPLGNYLNPGLHTVQGPELMLFRVKEPQKNNLLVNLLLTRDLVSTATVMAASTLLGRSERHVYTLWKHTDPNKLQELAKAHQERLDTQERPLIYTTHRVITDPDTPHQALTITRYHLNRNFRPFHPDFQHKPLATRLIDVGFLKQAALVQQHRYDHALKHHTPHPEAPDAPHPMLDWLEKGEQRVPAFDAHEVLENQKPLGVRLANAFFHHVPTTTLPTPAEAAPASS